MNNYSTFLNYNDSNKTTDDIGIDINEKGGLSGIEISQARERLLERESLRRKGLIYAQGIRMTESDILEMLKSLQDKIDQQSQELFKLTKKVDELIVWRGEKYDPNLLLKLGSRLTELMGDIKWDSNSRKYAEQSLLTEFE